MSPSAIFTQNARSTSRRIGGRPGDRIAGLPVCVTNQPGCLPITHLHIKVLRRPVESGQFTSWAFTQRALDAGLAVSMGSIGDCFDNAVIESFWARMQVELLNRRRWRTRLELSNAIFEYLEIFHNRQRRQGASHQVVGF